MVAAWELAFEGLEEVAVRQGDLTEFSGGAIVSPANSFGFMDGGIDYAISERLGWDLQGKLQAQIKDLPMGELLVGQALVLETGDELIPWLISAPTMRVPMNFNISTSINAYLATKAALNAAKSHPEIEFVAIPGMCTGVGRMPFSTAAHQMMMAYREVVLGEKMDFPDFGAAQRYQWRLNEDGMIFTH